VSRFFWLAALLTAALSTTIAGAQPNLPRLPSVTSAREAAVVAEHLQESGDWQEAIRLLEQVRSRCEAGPEGQPCHQILDYSLGYVYLQSSGVAEPGQQEDMLRKAAASFERVLGKEFDHAPALSGFASACMRLGRPERATEWVEAALETKPEYGVLLGDLYLQSGDIVRAQIAFRNAVRQIGDDTARRRLIATYELRPSTTPPLLELGKEWEHRSPAAAREAYEVAIQTSAAHNQPQAEEAFVRWVNLLVRSQNFSPEDLEALALPEGWNPTVLQSLRTYLQHPAEALDSENWQQIFADLQEVDISRVALALGKEKLEAGDARTAEAIWRAAAGWSGLVLQAGSSEGVAIEELRLLERGQIDSIDLLTALAMLYGEYPELDPKHEKFTELIYELYEEKGESYAGDDLEAIQRYHTALGRIYAEREIWTSGTDSETRKGSNLMDSTYNAIFHIWSALYIAEDRKHETDFYQPLAHLRELLAKGYRKTGDARAAETYLQACRAYLDSDDLDEAERILAQERGLLDGSQTVGLEIEALSRLLNRRRHLMRAASGEVTVERAAPAGLWGAGDSEFLVRQNFKMLADLAFAADRENVTELALHSAQQAIRTLIEKRAQLVGALDLLRLERLQAIIQGPFGLSSPQPEVFDADEVIKSEDGRLGGVSEIEEDGRLKKLIFGLTLPDPRPLAVLLSAKTALAAQLVDSLGPALALQASPRLRVVRRVHRWEPRHDKLEVIIQEAAPGIDIDDLRARILWAAGVDTVFLAEDFRWRG
jgi:hypothetical protein